MTSTFSLKQTVAFFVICHQEQCCGAGAARSRNFWPELEPECRSFSFGSRLRVVDKNQNSFCIESSMWIRLIFFHKKTWKIHFFNVKSVIKGKSKLMSEPAPESEREPEPDRKHKVLAPQHWPGDTWKCCFSGGERNVTMIKIKAWWWHTLTHGSVGHVP
jgi:hypothetical protein